MSDKFYENLDKVFEDIFKTYGFNDDLINYKKKILDSYENENIKKTNIKSELLKKTFKIDEDGKIIIL